jgi:succinyl-CoA synthetase beta subunit
LANDADQAVELAREMFGMDVRGYMASKVLVDEAIEVEQEIYLGITIDRSISQPAIVASAQGGVEIAEVVRETPERVYRLPIDPLLGLRVYQVRELAENIGLSREQLPRFAPVALSLYRAFVEYDAVLVEANPLVATPDGNLVSLNTRMVIDDNALFRHRDLIDMRDESQETPIERLARRHGISYVRLGGRVGCLSNGAGLAMATIDLLRAQGIRPANFVDIHKEADADKVAQGLRFALNGASQAVLISVFCSLSRCQEIARGIVLACQKTDLRVPLVIRLEGTDARAGHALLESLVDERGPANVIIAHSLRDAVQCVVDLLKRGRTGESL